MILNDNLFYPLCLLTFTIALNETKKSVMRFASSLHRQGAISFNSVILVQKDYINQIDSLCKSSSRFMKFLDEIFENMQW